MGGEWGHGEGEYEGWWEESIGLACIKTRIVLILNLVYVDNDQIRF